MTLTKFSVDVEGAAANMPLDVSINGVSVGTIMTDSEGDGRLVLASNPLGNQQPLPPGFPATLMAGDKVTVGTATGVLAAGGHQGEDEDNNDNEQGDQGNEGQETQLAAVLADPANAATTGHARFVSETEDGMTDTKFAVDIKGAAASMPLEVSINGVVVGHLMTDATGAGMLVLSSKAGTLPANFPAMVAAGDKVTVGTATGVLAAGGHQGEDED
jgi:hypothetical protein